MDFNHKIHSGSLLPLLLFGLPQSLASKIHIESRNNITQKPDLQYNKRMRKEVTIWTSLFEIGLNTTANLFSQHVGSLIYFHIRLGWKIICFLVKSHYSYLNSYSLRLDSLTVSLIASYLWRGDELKLPHLPSNPCYLINPLITFRSSPNRK